MKSEAGQSGIEIGLGRSPGEGNGNPLQYSGLGNPMDRGAWQATIYGVSRAGHDLRDLKNNNTEKILRDLNQVRNKADGLYNKVSIKNNL